MWKVTQDWSWLWLVFFFLVCNDVFCGQAFLAKTSLHHRIFQTTRLTPLHFQLSAPIIDGLTGRSLVLEQDATVAIRPATFTDLPAIAQLRTEVFFPTTREDSVFQEKLLEKLRLRYIRGSLQLLAANTTTEDVLGTVECAAFDFLNTTLDAFGSDRKLYLGDLAVHNASRRLGIATKLLEIAETFAQQGHYCDIYLHVEASNHIARMLYQNRGYEELPSSPEIDAFTASHLPKPVDSYVMLRKAIAAIS